jgi:DNA-binding transcriptional MerR regulator
VTVVLFPSVDTEYTLDELVNALGERIAAEDIRQEHGQVNGVPNARMLRYYTTLGLLDPPSGTRGRQATYDDHHIEQALLIKRLQAEGRTLGSIQAQLPDLLRRSRRPSGSRAWWRTNAAPARLPAGDLAIPLGRGVSLVVPAARPCPPAEIEAIAAAIGPLVLSYLQQRELLAPDPTKVT